MAASMKYELILRSNSNEESAADDDDAAVADDAERMRRRSDSHQKRIRSPAGNMHQHDTATARPKDETFPGWGPTDTDNHR